MGDLSIWADYKAQRAALIAFTIWAVWNMSPKTWQRISGLAVRQRLLAAPIVLFVLFIDSDPIFFIGPPSMAFCNDSLINTELSVFLGYTMGAMSRSWFMPDDEVIHRIRKGMGLPESAFTNPPIFPPYTSRFQAQA